MIDFNQKIGLARSILAYYAIPFRHQRLARFYANFIQRGDLCFDIGAHVGNRLRAWLDLGARVVGVEPQPHCMKVLRHWYGRHANVTLVEKALGAEAGMQTMFISRRTPTVTTLSRQWIEAVQQTDSFAGVRWDTAVPVAVTTLDALIAQYGNPVFCKIDVEGFEFEVLLGLSQPIQALSFEYVPATVEVAIESIYRLNQLGRYQFNWSLGETHRLQSAVWLKAKDMATLLSNMPADCDSGDIYARQVS